MILDITVEYLQKRVSFCYIFYYFLYQLIVVHIISNGINELKIDI